MLKRLFTWLNKTLLNVFPLHKLFLISQQALRSQQRTEKKGEVAFSSVAQRRTSDRGIIFRGGRLVSVGGSDGGKCEREQLNIISECCAV